MTATEFTVLDHLDNIRVSGHVFASPANEYWALVSLWQGMEFLYVQAKQCDETARQQLNPTGRRQVMAFGNYPGLSEIPQGLLTCAFHWYAVSACQYIRTVGTIAYRQDQSRALPLDYVRSVAPEVLAFRDKVAAHFAWNGLNRNDSEAEREASVMPQLSFVDDSFTVGAFTLSLNRGGISSNSSTITPWSIVKLHTALRLRYWPS